MTVSSVVPLIPSKVAVIVEVPTPRALAKPLLLAASLTDATTEALEAQLASKVRSWVDVSEKVPLTVHCVFMPLGIDGAAGVIVIAVIVAGLTVNERVAGGTLPTVAVRMADPGTWPVTRFGFDAVAKSATIGVSLDQTA